MLLLKEVGYFRKYRILNYWVLLIPQNTAAFHKQQAVLAARELPAFSTKEAKYSVP